MGMARSLPALLCFTAWCFLVQPLLALSVESGPRCPHVASIFDLPPLLSCKDWAQVATLPGCSNIAPGKICCAAALLFSIDGCGCWSGVFDHALVSSLATLSSVCLENGHLLGEEEEEEKTEIAKKEMSKGDERSMSKHPVSLYVGVLSSSSRADRRAAIRETWAHHAAIHSLRFFLASPETEERWLELESESRTFNDMVILPAVQESYFNISYQTLEIFRQATNAGPGITHVLKADDDSYVRVEELVRMLQERRHAQHLFMGWVENPGGGPHRDKGSRWYVSQEEWPSDRYPPWAHGAGYVLGADLAREIGKRVEPIGLFKLEDVAVGDWVERVAAERNWTVDYVSDTGFNFNGCRNTDVLSHYITAEGQRCLHQHGGRCSYCVGRKYRGHPH